MTNQERCDNDPNYVPNESESEESGDENLDISIQLQRKNLGIENREPENEMLVENIEEHIEIRRKRKRKPDTGSWKRQECKNKREKGEKYEGFRKNTGGKWVIDVDKPPREMKPFCNCKMSEKSKKVKCRMFTEEDRQDIFNQFWHNMTWSQKKIYISSHVDSKAPKDLKNQINENSRRSNTFVCHLKKNGVRERVCQVLFLNTLTLGTWCLHNWTTLGKDQNIDPPGTENVNLPHAIRTKTRHESDRSVLRNFFMELPKMESHYCRVSSTKNYLEPIWQSKAALYRSYIQYCDDKSVKCLSMKTFHEEFASNNLSLYSPKKDQCDLCVSYKAGNKDEQLYNQHIIKKNRARDEKSSDKSTARHVFTMDLQSILLCPMLKASKIYYKKKLVVHNFTLFNLVTKDAYCFLWHEAEGKVSANEFATILYNFIGESNLSEGEEIILYSDGCTAQNKNSTLSNALLHLSVSQGIIITQKYLVSGHTQMECDSMHSTIERKIRNREIYSPAGYIAACKSARLNPQPYQVKYLNHTYFKNFTSLNYHTSIRPGYKTGDSTVNDLCAIQYRPDGKLYYKLNFDDNWIVLEKRLTRKDPGVGDIVPLYQNPLPIKKSKYDHLQQLKEVIPADYHLFYDTLPFKAD